MWNLKNGYKRTYLQNRNRVTDVAKKSCKRTYLQNRNGVTDVENNLMVNAGEEEERQIGILGLTYIHTIYKTENQ